MKGWRAKTPKLLPLTRGRLGGVPWTCAILLQKSEHYEPNKRKTLPMLWLFLSGLCNRHYYPCYLFSTNRWPLYSVCIVRVCRWFCSYASGVLTFLGAGLLPSVTRWAYSCTYCWYRRFSLCLRKIQEGIILICLSGCCFLSYACSYMVYES